MLAQQCRLLHPGNTFCALAPGAVEPLESGLNYFRQDFEDHISKKRCPLGNHEAEEIIPVVNNILEAM